MCDCGHMHTSPDTYTYGVLRLEHGLQTWSGSPTMPAGYLLGTRTLPIVARAAVLGAIGTMQDRYSGARAQGKAAVLGTSVSVLYFSTSIAACLQPGMEHRLPVAALLTCTRSVSPRKAPTTCSSTFTEHIYISRESSRSPCVEHKWANGRPMNYGRTNSDENGYFPYVQSLPAACAAAPPWYIARRGCFR